MFPPPCLRRGDGVLGVIGSIPPPPPKTREPKELDFGLIWPQHFHPVILWILANIRWACRCAFLSRGTVRALRDFIPFWRSVLPNVFLVTMVPAALRSLIRSSRVVLGWFLTVLMIIENPRGEILHGAPVRRRLTVILSFFHLRIILQTVPFSSWRWSCSPLQPWVGLQSCPWHPWMALLSWPWWREESDWLIEWLIDWLIDWLLLWTGVFYSL